MDSDVKRYAEAYPQHREALVSLQAILDFQADQAAKLKQEPSISPEAARARWQDGYPLFSAESPPIPPSLFRDALTALRSLLPPGEPFQDILDRLLASHHMAPGQVENLLHHLFRDREACIQQLAVATAGDPDTLTLLLQTALSPFFQQQAVPYRAWIETFAWRRGVCPVCGSEPGMARLLKEDGRRILVCPLCYSQWPFDRLRCPFCEADGVPNGQPRTRYFTVDDDQVHRVDCCDRCRRYIVTVDERVWGGSANVFMEEVVTGHLDGLAREQGYR